jgi:hypothetical protein
MSSAYANSQLTEPPPIGLAIISNPAPGCVTISSFYPPARCRPDPGVVEVSRMAMPRPPILDLLKAVSSVAPAHREVAVWWYVPPGSDPGSGAGPPPAELGLQTDRDAATDLETIRSRLAGLLGDP